MRTLVLNDFFTGWSGSEIVAMEVAEHFNATTSSFVALEPALSALRDWRPLDEISLADFDLVWAQHHAVLPLLDRHVGQMRPHIVFASLSPYEPMETIPASVLEHYVDQTIANSTETARVRHADIVLGNAAPEPFHQNQKHSPSGQCTRILFVSNNQPPEIVEAAEILAKNATVRFIGREREYKRLTPADILWADSVVTIGKTARYALACAKPVFIYDRFGGDGYLTDMNYAENEEHNFSGRPSCRKLAPWQLAEEILAMPDWSPPPQPSLADVLNAISPSPHTFSRHPDLHGLADIARALGNFITANAHQTIATDGYKRYFDGDAGGWRWIAKVTRRKFARTFLQPRVPVRTK